MVAFSSFRRQGPTKAVTALALRQRAGKKPIARKNTKKQTAQLKKDIVPGQVNIFISDNLNSF